MPNSHDAAPVGRVYRRLLGYVRPHWRGFAFALLTMAVVAATETGFAALMKPLLDGSFVQKDPVTIRWIPILLLGLFLVRGVCTFVSSYFMSAVGRDVIFEMRRQMFDRLLRLPVGFYDTTSSAQLGSKMIFEVEQVSSAATSVITIVVRDTLTVAGLLAWMFYLNWMLSSIFLVIGPVIAVLVLSISRRFRRLSHNIQTSMGDVSQIAKETVDGQRVVKIFGGQEYETERFRKVNAYNQRQNMKLAVTSSANVPVTQFVAACALSAIIYFATLGPVLESITVGTFMSLISAMMLLMPSLKRLTNVNVQLQRGIAACQSIFDLIDRPQEPDTGTKQLARVQGAVEYRDVSFGYPGQDGCFLKEISLKIEPGQTVAFVGRSGSGKSTLVSLLPRFYELTSGTITVDGHDIRDVRLADLRRQMALVTQHITLFNDTIARNIAYGMLESATEQEIVRAAEAAHAMEFIRQLPEGLNTLVGENGVLLSGGQRQRIAIARALLKNAPILILDEATSALDTESERKIQSALEHLMRDRTTLVIAHRLSTIEHADRIFVLDEGRIVESGRHADLLARGGHYARLHQMQFHDNHGAG